MLLGLSSSLVVSSGEDPTFFSPDPAKTKNRIRIRPKFDIFFNELLTGIFSASLKLEYVDSGLNILSKMEIILYTRCYRSDPDPVRKVPDPYRQVKNHRFRILTTGC